MRKSLHVAESQLLRDPVTTIMGDAARAVRHHTVSSHNIWTCLQGQIGLTWNSHNTPTLLGAKDQFC